MESNYIIDKQHLDTEGFNEVIEELLHKSIRSIDINGGYANTETYLEEDINSDPSKISNVDIQTLLTEIYMNIVNDFSDKSQNKFLSAYLGNALHVRLQRIEEVINAMDYDTKSFLLAHLDKTLKGEIQELIKQVYRNIVDNINDTNSNKFLSANMGNKLHTRIKALEDTVNGGGSINSNFPRGAIVMWSGSLNQIPDGWALCDGLDGRPNLIDKFVKGIEYENKRPGTIGGSHRLLIKQENMPQHSHNMVHTHKTKKHVHDNSHTHKINFRSEVDGEHDHQFKDDTATWKAALYKTDNIISASHNNSGDYIVAAARKKINNYDNDYTFSESTKDSVRHSHNVYGVTDYNDVKTGETMVEIEQYRGYSQNAGRNIPINNQPEYYEVAFIIKL